MKRREKGGKLDSTPRAAKKQSATRLDELNKARGRQVLHDLERGPENKG